MLNERRALKQEWEELQSLGRLIEAESINRDSEKAEMRFDNDSVIVNMDKAKMLVNWCAHCYAFHIGNSEGNCWSSIPRINQHFTQPVQAQTV